MSSNSQWWAAKPDISLLSLEDQFEFAKLNMILPGKPREYIMLGYVNLLERLGQESLLADHEVVIAISLLPTEALIKITLHVWVQWATRQQMLPLLGF